MEMQQIEPVRRLTRDLMKAHTLSDKQARFFVDEYYIIQEDRKRAANQVRSLIESGEPNELINWLLDNMETLENQIKRMLDRYSMQSDTGEWSRSVVGIGPVIAAGLLAHIDIEQAPTVGHIWNYAGLNPDISWDKGKKRPWNASLKTLCWKIGESFVKVSNREDAFYGKIYQERKEQEQIKNENNEYATQAEAKLQKYKIGKSTDAYKHYSAGKLPPAHIHARAKRYAVKLFLSHWHEVAYRNHYGVAPPNPYPIAVLGHAHKIEVPR